MDKMRFHINVCDHGYIGDCPHCYMEKPKIMYFVMTFNLKNETFNKRDGSGTFDAITARDRRVVGYYSKLEDARNCVLENWGDIIENSYKYCLIEEMPEGLYGAGESKVVGIYKVSKDVYEFPHPNPKHGMVREYHYEELTDPDDPWFEYSKHSINFTIG